MPPLIPERSLDGGSERLEFFSDAIMAIAITLLVFAIPAPDARGGHLAHDLLHIWPSYVAFILSFCTIGLIWVAHHSMFRRIGDVDRQMLLINLVLMMFVAFLPFSTRILAHYSWHNDTNASVSVELYSLNMLAIGLSFLALWIYQAQHRNYFLGTVTKGSLNAAIRRALVPPAAYALSCALAFVSTPLCYAIWTMTTIYIAFGPSTRRIPSWAEGTSPGNKPSQSK